MASSPEQRQKWREEKKRVYLTRRDSILKNRYGIREFDYEELAKAQNNKCAICGISPTNKRLDLDHCHNTKKIRGLLCNNCNRGLGHFKDSIDLLNKAKTYLINSQQAEIPTVYGATSAATVEVAACNPKTCSNRTWISDFNDGGYYYCSRCGKNSE